MRTLLSIEIGYPDDTLLPPDRRDALRLGVVALTTDGGIRASVEDRLEIRVPDDVRTSRLHYVVALPRGQSALRVGIVSDATGRTGTVHLPTDLPAFDGERLELSGLVIGRANQAALPARGSSAATDVLPFPATTDRTFAPRDVLRVFTRVFPPADGAPEVSVRLTSGTDRTVVVTATLKCAASALVAGAEDCVGELFLVGVEPGAYVLTASATAGDEQAARAMPIRVSEDRYGAYRNT